MAGRRERDPSESGLWACMSNCARGCQLREIDLRSAQDMFRRAWIVAGLELNGNNQNALADASRVHRNTISRIMQSLKIEKSASDVAFKRRPNGYSDEFFSSK